MITTGTEIFREIMTAGRSLSESRRYCLEGAVTLNGTEITQLTSEVEVSAGDVLRVGKRSSWTHNGEKWIKAGE